MKIILDTMGSDKGYEEMVKGAIDGINELGVNIALVGREDLLQKELAKYSFPEHLVEIINAEESISNEDEPVLAIRRKKNSSMVIGLKALAEGKGDGFVSTGNTGALLAGGLFIVKRIDGVERAALATVFPTRQGFSFMLDVGANVDSKPEYLVQFATMGAIYSEKVLGIQSPTVGLANIGVEEGKGNALVREAYRLLSDTKLNFIGNVEVRDIPEGFVDVIICDGFVGNTILKVTEGMAMSMFSLLKEQFTSSLKSKLGALMLKPELQALKANLDYREYGGAPLLGLKKPVIKAHGSSDALAIKNAIRQVKTFLDNNVIQIIEKNINF